MKLKVERRWKKATYTIGRIYIDGVYYCNTLEDRDRGLKQTDSLTYIKARKVAGETAIPTGTYIVSMNTTSPKYAGVPFYWNFCKGKMPRLLAVPGFDGILIHIGNRANPDSSGCILVGVNDRKGMVTKSTETFRRLWYKLKEADKRGENISITIK